MSVRRVTLGALLVALLASLVLVAVAWRSAPRPVSSALPAGTLRFGDLMVVGAVETPDQFAALQRDCADTRAAAGTALAQLPASAATGAARTALERYGAFCRWYVVTVRAARQVQDLQHAYVQSYRFSGSIRASDGTVYDCVDPDPPSTGPPTCWTPDRSRWPELARLLDYEAAFDRTRAAYLSTVGCPWPDLVDVCTAQTARDRARAVSIGVFADALSRGDTRVFTWLGVPATIGIAEADRADAADRAYLAACRRHGFADDDGPTPYQRDRMKQFATTIRAALNADAPR